MHSGTQFCLKAGICSLSYQHGSQKNYWLVLNFYGKKYIPNTDLKYKVILSLCAILTQP